MAKKKRREPKTDKVAEELKRINESMKQASAIGQLYVLIIYYTDVLRKADKTLYLYPSTARLSFKTMDDLQEYLANIKKDGEFLVTAKEGILNYVKIVPKEQIIQYFILYNDEVKHEPEKPETAGTGLENNGKPDSAGVSKQTSKKQSE